jgi:deoxycytidine triphosphate deaminase
MSVLGAAEIERLKDEIFAEGTFSASCLRTAAYDLRVQIDRMGSHSPGLETDHATVVLNKGDTVALESVELLSVPWELAANIGIKHRRAMRGLFISPGLFIDPGFGRSLDSSEADGCRLKFLATNMGKDPIELRLGPEGDHVVGIQFFRVDGAGPKREVQVSNDSAKGLAIFGDLAKVENSVREIEETAHRTMTATESVVVFGVFLVTAAIIGAIFTALIAIAASGDGAANVVTAINQLDLSRPTTIGVLVCLLLLALGVTTWLASQVSKLFSRIWRHKKTSTSSG